MHLWIYSKYTLTSYTQKFKKSYISLHISLMKIFNLHCYKMKTMCEITTPFKIFFRKIHYTELKMAIAISHATRGRLWPSSLFLSCIELLNGTVITDNVFFVAAKKNNCGICKTVLFTENYLLLFILIILGNGFTNSSADPHLKLWTFSRALALSVVKNYIFIYAYYT